jgi:Flp pilus assembly protein TadG
MMRRALERNTPCRVAECWRFRRNYANQRGQALVEAGMVMVLLITLIMGVFEFGRVWMIGNLITNAAREGARAAALLSTANGRDTTTKLIPGGCSTTVSTAVQTQIQNTTGLTLSVCVTPQAEPAGSTIPMVGVTVSGAVPYIFRLFGASEAVNKTVTFRDEGRG